MGKGTLALVFGILGFVVPFVGIIFAILAIVYGKAAKDDPEEKGMATAGLILGIISLVVSIITAIYIIFMFSTLLALLPYY
ncbi:MAG: DUF4190 domain-containing protein [Promethearchaeia archaeon]